MSKQDIYVIYGNNPENPKNPNNTMKEMTESAERGMSVCVKNMNIQEIIWAYHQRFIKIIWFRAFINLFCELRIYPGSYGEQTQPYNSKSNHTTYQP